MSLSFAPGYVPSEALRAAIQDAHDAGVVMVGAAGNDARDDVPSWPSASPVVISVAASTLKSGDDPTDLTFIETDYTNLGVGIDLLAPGGDLARDENNDGYGDGLIGESFAVGQPDQPAPFMFAGSSQAAALVSGGAAWLLASGAEPHEVRSALTEGAGYFSTHSFDKGTGAGTLNIQGAIASLASSYVTNAPRFGASLLVYPAEEVELDGSIEVEGHAIVRVQQLSGAAASNSVTVYGTVWSPDGVESWECSVDLKRDPTCEVKGEDVSAGTGGAWAFSVEAVVEKGVGVPFRPVTLQHASDALELVLTAIGDHTKVNNRPIALRWEAMDHPQLGELAAGYSVHNSGTGLATSPFGVVFTPNAVTIGGVKDVELDLDGTGLATSPLGFWPVQRVNIDGTGLATSPFGFQQLSFVALSGTGLATSPFGFAGMNIYAPVGPNPTLGMGIDGGVMVMDTAELVGVTAGADAQATADLLDGSSQMGTIDGFEAASLLVGSGAAQVGLTASGDALATGEMSAPLE